jgi:predicted acyl esterase
MLNLERRNMKKNWRELISQPKYGIKEARDIWVPMRDGVKLSVNVFRPDARGKFPALLSMSSYGKEEQEYLLPPQPLFKSAVWDGNIEAGDNSEIVPRGYVHIVCDVRGTGHSEGEFFGGYTPQEGRDGYDLIEWAAKQPWCDGNVGMVGYSYFSKVQLKVAIEQPPHLKTIFMSHVDPDHYRDSVYHGGVLSLFPYGIWDGRHGTSGIARKNAVSEAVKTMPKKEFERVRQELLNHPDIKHYPNLFHLLHYPQKNPRFFDMMMYPYDGPFWWDRSAYPFYDKIKVPAYVVGKTPHEGGGFWQLYDGLKSPKKLLVKPSGPEERPWREDIELLIRWYDHWLKGNDTGIMDEPPIKLYVTGINQYRFVEKWPLPGTEWVKCYPRRWEGLLFEPELYQPEPDCFLQQPLHVSTKRDSVKYISPPVPENLEVIGPASMHLFAAIDQDDTNWIVKLYDVSPNGSESRLAKGFLKASHRALDPDKSQPYAPWHPHTSSQPVDPGQIYEYDIGLGVVNNVFTPGHRIKLEIESMESPRDPEMQIHYHPHLNSSKTTLHKIYRDREHQSHLVLPIVNKKPSVIEMLSDDNFL